MSQSISVTPDRRTLVEAEVLRAGFLDQGFNKTMRFSELNGEEEFDNSFLWMLWHGYIEFGLGQLREYAHWILRELEMDGSDIGFQDKLSQQKPLDYLEGLLKKREDIPFDQRARIYRFFQDLLVIRAALKDKTPIDHKDRITLIRSYLADYNENLSDAIILYDGHYAILNGRMARGKGHKKDLLEVVKDQRQREKEIQMGEENKKHGWNRLNPF